MELLKLALDSRVPFVHVRTDDLLNVQKILSFLAYGPGGKTAIPAVAGDLNNIPPDEVVFTSDEGLYTQKAYQRLKLIGSTLVFVNVKPQTLHLQTGTMLPPKELILQEVADFVDGDAALTDELLPAFGGMTLKDTYELLKMTQERDGVLTAKGVNRTRQGYVARLKGISQIDSSQDFYDVPTQLQSWVDLNLKLFQNPVHPTLTPRGLLLDGPPGTGKTEAAKYLAGLLGVPLYHLDVANMKGKYVGDSEGALNAALTQIDQASPCVVLFDEVEKIFATTQGGGDSGVTSGLLSQLLWWLQEHKTTVLSVMTTNRKDILPKELYRPGRIDKVLTFMGLDSESAVVSFGLRVVDLLDNTTGVGPFSPDEVSMLRKGLKNFATEGVMEGNFVSQASITNYVREQVKFLLAKRG